MYVPAYDFSRVGVGDQAYVDTLVRCGQVRDVSNPHLLASRCAHLIRTGFEQVGMPPETVMAVRGLMVRPLGWNKHPAVAKHGKQCIAPEPDALLTKRFGQHVVKLASAYARLAHTLVLNHLHHHFGALVSLDRPAAILIVGLATHAHELASPAYAEPLDEGLLEDLPEGFFTMRTP